MEESQIIDSNTEAKASPLPIIIGIVAAVLAVLAFIIAIRLNGTVNSLANSDSASAASETARKVVDDEVTTLKKNISSNFAVLKTQIDLLNSNVATLRNAPAGNAAPQIAQLTQRIQSLEAQIKSLEARRVTAPADRPVARNEVRPVAQQPAPAPVANDPAKNVVTAGGIYTVVSGDSLHLIARKHGVSLHDIEVLNPNLASRPTLLKLGEKVKIPAKSQSANAAPATRREAQPNTARGAGTRR